MTRIFVGAQYAFSKCSALTSVNISDSVTSIGDGAFEFCRSLTSFYISDSLTFIGSGAFLGNPLNSVCVRSASRQTAVQDMYAWGPVSVSVCAPGLHLSTIILIVILIVNVIIGIVWIMARECNRKVRRTALLADARQETKAPSVGEGNIVLASMQPKI